MCGIAGFLDASAASSTGEATARVEAMNRAIAHRGPDDFGTFVDAAAGIALGHRRLSIIDLSPLGHQPMTSADGRYVITYNGEVYNFAELRAELDALGHRFRGGSDTEVMLAAFVAWGVERATTRFVGMFAIGLWDRQTRTLYLIRDRIGVKPLYWCRHRGVLLFGSELKALMAHPAWKRRNRHRGRRRLHPLQLCTRTRDDLSRRAEAPARHDPDAASRRGAAHRALLAPARRCRQRRPSSLRR